MDSNHFSNFSFPQPKEAPYEIWPKTGSAASEEKSFENVNRRADGRTNPWTMDEKWSL